MNKNYENLSVAIIVIGLAFAFVSLVYILSESEKPQTKEEVYARCVKESSYNNKYDVNKCELILK